MREFVAVALGGMLGSLARYIVGLGVSRAWATLNWPLATLLVNVLGCFAIGLFSAAAKRWQWLDTPMDLAVRIGILGGFTTFSSFGLEAVRLWQADRALAASSVIFLNVAMAVVAVVLGEWLFKSFFDR
ncbi:MAG: fluoride efflux transporter CrcB [Pirellulaceae bacterium]|nr:fluoride efflux transporter CrcB [Pirellulaceae bacterium]